MLSLQNIAHFYGHRLIFKHISLDIPAGVTLLIGPNGAGKTTLLAIMGGLITPTSGTVLIPEDCRIAMLGHNTFLYPELTGLENLIFWSRLYGISPTTAMLDSVLEQVGLSAFGQERAGTYSRGMAQRLSLARLLLIKPDIMLLDEPGTGLDTFSLHMLHKTIQDFASMGTTIVWVTHSVETDWTFANSIVSLEKSRIAHCLPAAEYADKFLRSGGANAPGPCTEPYTQSGESGPKFPAKLPTDLASEAATAPPKHTRPTTAPKNTAGETHD